MWPDCGNGLMTLLDHRFYPRSGGLRNLRALRLNRRNWKSRNSHCWSRAAVPPWSLLGTVLEVERESYRDHGVELERRHVFV